MNSPQCGLRVAGAIFGLVSLAQLLRLLFGVQVVVAGKYPVPLWPSGVACVVAGLLAFWLWRLSLSAGTPATTPPPPVRT
ncbi:MAG: hypothetical protein HYV75_04635 [Opitutae bacterium]|nr:hypothetical protein [Opitutae bacterium]